MTFDFKQIIDNISNIEGLENTTILKTLKEFEKYILENAVKGATGERGPQGPTGPEGPQGLRGPKGDSGATLNSFEFTPDTQGASYSDEQMTMTGKLRFSVLVNGIAEYHTINATIKTNITGSDDIILDTNEDGTAIEIHLDNDVRNKLAKALVTPMSAPYSTELVGIDTSNSQTNIKIGEGLSIVDGSLIANSGSSGGALQVLEVTGRPTAIFDKIRATGFWESGKILKLDVIGGASASAKATASSITTTGSGTSTTEQVPLFHSGSRRTFYPMFNDYNERQFVCKTTTSTWTLYFQYDDPDISYMSLTPVSNGLNIKYVSKTWLPDLDNLSNYTFRLFYFE